MSEDEKQSPSRSARGPSIEKWGKVGGVIGFVVTIVLFGFGGSSAGPNIWSSFIKGFLGGGIGALVFGVLAALVGARMK